MTTDLASRLLQSHRNVSLIRTLIDLFITMISLIFESADYWKLTKDGGLKYDGSGWLVGPDGKPVRDKNGKQIGAEGIETGLLNILFGGQSGATNDQFNANQKAMARSTMENAGLFHTFDPNNPNKANGDDWSWNGTQTFTIPGDKKKYTYDYDAMNIAGANTINKDMLDPFAGTIAETVFRQGWQGAIDSAAGGNFWVAGGPNPLMQRTSRDRMDQMVAADKARIAANNAGYPPVNANQTMQDLDPNNNISLGGSGWTLGGAGCRITAAGRILNAAGVDITVQALAQNKDNFVNNDGDLNDTHVFEKYGLTLSGPYANVETVLKNYVNGGSQGWVYGTVPWGGNPNGHTINITNVTIGANGSVGIDKQNTSSGDSNRTYGVYNSNAVNYYKLSQIYIVKRNPK